MVVVVAVAQLPTKLVALFVVEVELEEVVAVEELKVVCYGLLEEVVVCFVVVLVVIVAVVVVAC